MGDFALLIQQMLKLNIAAGDRRQIASNFRFDFHEARLHLVSVIGVVSLNIHQFPLLSFGTLENHI